MNKEVKITLRDGSTITASGKAFMVGGHEFIAHRSIRGRANGWQVTCAVTGKLLTNGHDTQKKAMEAAYEVATRVDNHGGPGAFDSQMTMNKEGALIRGGA